MNKVSSKNGQSFSSLFALSLYPLTLSLSLSRFFLLFLFPSLLSRLLNEGKEKLALLIMFDFVTTDPNKPN
jgi:hypothetical protein